MHRVRIAYTEPAPLKLNDEYDIIVRPQLLFSFAFWWWCGLVAACRGRLLFVSNIYS